MLTADDATGQCRAGISTASPNEDPTLGMVQDAELLAEAVVDTIRQPLLLLDARLEVRLANRSFYRMFRVKPQDTVGCLVYEIGDGQWDIPDLRRLLDELLPNNSSFENFEVEHDFPGVGRKNIVLNARKLRRRETQEGLILLALEDVTERIALDRQLRQSNEDLRQFATVASHDLQAPLRSIGAFADLLVRRYAGRLDDDADDFLRYIVQNVSTMRGLINELLAYARAGSQDYAPARVSTSDALKQAISNLTSEVEESGGTIDFDDLPMVNADPGQLTQVFQNLLSNSLKYRKRDHPPRVRVSATRENTRWLISVADNGLGFNPAEAEAVFTPFRRLHGSGYPGSGIGLAICKRIVERNGGEIWADAAEGGGSIFLFTLPASSDE